MDSVAMLGRLIVSLAFVLAIVWFLARRVGKRTRGRDAGLIDVLSRQQLSRNSSIAVVRVGEQALIVGVSDSQVSVLGDTDLDTALATTAAKPGVKAAGKTARVGLRRTAATAGVRRIATTPHTTTPHTTTPHTTTAHAAAPHAAAAHATTAHAAAPHAAIPHPTSGRTDASVTQAITPAVVAPLAPRHASPDATDGAAQLTEPTPRSPLAGSALSPQTWKQTLESLREMTAR